MHATAVLPAPKAVSREVVALQCVTLLWMLVECSTALTAAAHAHSVSLLAFGSDSLVELISAAVVLLQFVPGMRISQTQAARVCGLLLYVLAATVTSVALAGLYLHNSADTSRLGMVITACALLLMPVLARRKRDAADGCPTGRCVQTRCSQPHAPTWQPSLLAVSCCTPWCTCDGSIPSPHWQRSLS